MKVIFLDIDGVLNSGMSDGYKDSPWFIDPLNVKAINRLFKEIPDVFVCLSSSWKIPHVRKMINVNDRLKEAGWEGPLITETTPDLLDSERGDEIALWLSNHSDVDKFVIIDDDDDMGNLIGRLVQTSFEDGGLLDQHVNEIVRRLK